MLVPKKGGDAQVAERLPAAHFQGWQVLHDQRRNDEGRNDEGRANVREVFHGEFTYLYLRNNGRIATTSEPRMKAAPVMSTAGAVPSTSQASSAIQKQRVTMTFMSPRVANHG